MTSSPSRSVTISQLSRLPGLSGTDTTQRVPATAGWAMHDVLAHLAGVTEDAATGNMTGAPGDAWTAAQVARGAGRADAELLATWAEHAPALEGLLSSPHGAAVSAAVMDVHCHEADLRHALGLAAELPAEFLAGAIGGVITWLANTLASAVVGLAVGTTIALVVERLPFGKAEPAH